MKRKNIKTTICEEIALEGLDGITFQALWLRLGEATSTNPNFTNTYKELVWQLIQPMPTMSFYILEEPRPDLIIFNRFTAKDYEKEPDDIYPHHPIDDKQKNVRGSCATYYTRRDVTETARKMKYDEICNEWGSCFVIVASQSERERALFGHKSKTTTSAIVRYCLLERIGRSRYLGEITHGKNSLLALGEDPKSLFYHRKELLRYNIITKQTYHQKKGTVVYNGTLLHLKRFYTEQIPKVLKLTELVVAYLRTKPNYMALYDDVKQLGRATCFRKLFKSPEFQMFVKTDIRIPYRSMFPNAEVIEWRMKNSDNERQLRVLQLIDPEKDVREHWPQQSNHEILPAQKHHDNGNNVFARTYLKQACKVIKEHGGDGCSQTELGSYLGLPKLTARSLTRNLVRTNMVAAFMNDVGRQRVTRFCYREFEKTGSMAQKFYAERQKTLRLLLNQDASQMSEATDECLVDKEDLHLYNSQTTEEQETEEGQEIEEGQELEEGEEREEDSVFSASPTVEKPKQVEVKDFEESEPEAKRLRLEEEHLSEAENQNVEEEEVEETEGLLIGYP